MSSGYSAPVTRPPGETLADFVAQRGTYGRGLRDDAGPQARDFVGADAQVRTFRGFALIARAFLFWTATGPSLTFAAERIVLR